MISKYYVIFLPKFGSAIMPACICKGPDSEVGCLKHSYSGTGIMDTGIMVLPWILVSWYFLKVKSFNKKRELEEYVVLSIQPRFVFSVTPTYTSHRRLQKYSNVTPTYTLPSQIIHMSVFQSVKISIDAIFTNARPQQRDIFHKERLCWKASAAGNIFAERKRERDNVADRTTSIQSPDQVKHKIDSKVLDKF